MALGEHEVLHQAGPGEHEVLHQAGPGEYDVLHQAGTGEYDVLHQAGPGEYDILHRAALGEYDVLHQAAPTVASHILRSPLPPITMCFFLKPLPTNKQSFTFYFLQQNSPHL